MKALLLAAGRSKRMAPVGDKSFLEMSGKPLLQWQLDGLLESGFDDVAVVCGAHNRARIEDLVKDMPKVNVIEQSDLDMGMCGAVLSSKDFISGEPVLIFSSNDVVEKSAFALLLDAAKKDGSSASCVAESYLLGKTVDKYFPGGYLETDSDGFISGIIEKPGEGNEPSNLVNLVVHLHTDSARLIAELESAQSSSDDLYEVAMDKMMKDGVKFKSVAYDGFWQPIKFPWHVHNVFKFFFDQVEKGVSENATVSDNAVINGDVVIADGAKVFDGAVINGPAYIGKNSVVATNALVRDSYVGENCVIGFSTEIARSYLGHDVWTHTNYVGDSVIGNNVSFGSGAVTGNLRLDEANIMVDFDGKKMDTQTNKFGLICGDNVRFGINASLMPGIKIGSNSFIGSGIVVSENIPEKSFVRGKWELKISENKASVETEGRDDARKNLG